MLRWLFLFAATLAALPAQVARIGVDPRVELLSIIFRLSGAGEYNQGAVPGYIKAIDSHFAPFKDHEVVQIAKQLRSEDGVSFDAVMSMAVHIKDVTSLAERVPFDAPDSRLERRWKPAKARRFLAAAQKFVEDTNFAGFLQSQKPLIDETDRRMSDFVRQQAKIDWFQKFFGAKAAARLFVVPGITNGGSSYGASLTAEDGVEEIYAIPGVWQVDASGIPIFTQALTTLVHEFVHSYANPVIDKAGSALDAAGQKLFEARAEEMRAQAYGTGRTVLYESLVRASTARYVAENMNPVAAAAVIGQEKGRGFLWTQELVDVLGEYSRSRDRYPTLESYIPRLVEFFNGITGKVADMAKAFEASRPQIVSITIKDGATDVDAELKEVVIRFDRPMRKDRYSVARTDPKRETPEWGKPVFDDEGKVLTIPLAKPMKPGVDYAFSLNFPGGGSFQTVDGIPLKHVAVTFRTRAASK